MSEQISFQRYDDFWLFYVREHSSPANRLLHFLGTTLALSVLGYAIAAKDPQGADWRVDRGRDLKRERKRQRRNERREDRHVKQTGKGPS